MRINKLFLLICLIALLSYKGFGQTYQKVAIPDTTTWLVAQAQLSGRFIDTLYAKNQTDDKIEIWFGSKYGDEQMFLGLLSSNEDNSKLWFAPEGTSNNEEILIFDLTLEKGDTFYLGNTSITVDTVFYRDNLKHIELNRSTIWDENLRFIEGVGPNISVAWMAHPGILEPYVVCKYDDTLFYVAENPNFIDCNLDTTNSEELYDYYEINIYPNPFEDCLLVYISSLSTKTKIIISDMKGRIVFNDSFSYGYNEICLNYLQSGSYVINFLFNKTIYKSKIIKL